MKELVQDLVVLVTLVVTFILMLNSNFATEWVVAMILELVFVGLFVFGSVVE